MIRNFLRVTNAKSAKDDDSDHNELEVSDEEDFEPLKLQLDDIHRILSKYDGADDDDNAAKPKKQHKLFKQYQRSVQRGHLMFQQTAGHDSTTEIDNSCAMEGKGLEAQLKAMQEARKAEASTLREMPKITKREIVNS